MKTQNLLKMLFVATALAVCTAPVFAQTNIAKYMAQELLGENVTKSLMEKISKTEIEDAFAYETKQHMMLSMSRSKDVMDHHTAPFQQGIIGPIENEQLWPDYKLLQDIMQDYTTLLAAHRLPTEYQINSLFDRPEKVWSPEQYLLSRLMDEEQAFLPEINRAERLWDEVHAANVSGKATTAEYKAQLTDQIKQYIPNPTLQKDLLKAVEQDDFATVTRDLQEYYSLFMDDAEAAYQYALHHPHGRNLALRRVLANPLVKQEDKKILKRLLFVPKLEGQQAQMFKQFTTRVFDSQKQLKKYFANSTAIKNKIRSYNNFYQRLSDFVNQNKRLPDMFTPEENILAVEYNFFLSNLKLDNMEPFITIHKKVDALAAQYSN